MRALTASASSRNRGTKLSMSAKLVDGEALLLCDGGYQPPDFRGVGQDVGVGGGTDRRAEGQARRAQTGVGEDRVQRGAEPRAEPHGLEGADDPRRYLPEQWEVRDAARRGDVVLGERDHAAGAHQELSCRSVAAGSGRCIRISRPTTASTGSSKAIASIEPCVKCTVVKPCSAARARASATISGAASTPRTVPVGPTSRRR